MCWGPARQPWGQLEWLACSGRQVPCSSAWACRGARPLCVHGQGRQAGVECCAHELARQALMRRARPPQVALHAAAQEESALCSKCA